MEHPPQKLNPVPDKALVIVAGSRDFNDKDLMFKELDTFMGRYTKDQVTIISGTARGADRLGEEIALEHGVKLIRMPAEWDKYGKSAGYRRNEDMARKATHLLAFWDGKSRGTKHMIDIATKRKLIMRVVPF